VNNFGNRIRIWCRVRKNRGSEARINRADYLWMVAVDREVFLKLVCLASFRVVSGLNCFFKVDWSGLPCEGRFWERKLGTAEEHYL
jgi:hypothetical protein